jgi:hypothetical protein
MKKSILIMGIIIIVLVTIMAFMLFGDKEKINTNNNQNSNDNSGGFCEDSDGKDYYTVGKTIGNSPTGNDAYATSFDSCSPYSNDGKTLIEYYCEGDGFRSEDYQCPNGCSNGVCRTEPGETELCTDSDGLDYYEMGRARGDWYGPQNPHVDKMDSCEDDSTLVEQYCKTNHVRSETYNCPNGCSDGACI